MQVSVSEYESALVNPHKCQLVANVNIFWLSKCYLYRFAKEVSILSCSERKLILRPITIKK